MQVHDQRPAASGETNRAVVEFKVRFGLVGYKRPGESLIPKRLSWIVSCRISLERKIF